MMWATRALYKAVESPTITLAQIRAQNIGMALHRYTPLAVTCIYTAATVVLKKKQQLWCGAQ